MPYKVTERLCVNTDRSKLVDCDSPEAHWELGLPGHELPDEVARRYGLLPPEGGDGKAGKAKAEAEPAEPAEAAEEKAVEAAPKNKAVLAPKLNK